MKRYRMLKYLCIVGIVGLNKNACYAQAAPPEFELTSASTSSGDICGVRAFSQITRCDIGITTDTVCINGIPCITDPTACTSGPTEVTTNEYSLIAEAEAVVFGDIVELNQSVTSTVSHEIAYSLMDTSDSLLFSGKSIVLHEIIFGGDCEFVCGVKPKGQTTWSGDGCADFSIDFSLSKSAIIRLTELHSTMFGRMVGNGANEALSTFSWRIIDLSPPPGCSSPCIAVQGTPSVLGPNETYNAGGPSDVGLESGDYRFEAFYDYSPKNPLECEANQNPPADEKLKAQGSGEVGAGVCGPDPCIPPNCSNGEIDEWRIELLIVGEDCNGNGIADSLDVDPNDPDGNEFVSEDFNLDGVPDECQCIADIAPVDPDFVCGYGDGVVDELDLLRLLANSGDCSTSGADLGYCADLVCDADGTNCAPLCEGDLNRDGVVDGSDFVELLFQMGDCQIPPYTPYFAAPFSLVADCHEPARQAVDATLDGVSNPTVGAISMPGFPAVADDFIPDNTMVLSDITWMGYEHVDANCGSTGCGMTPEFGFFIKIYKSILHPNKGVPIPDNSEIVGDWKTGRGFVINRALAGYDETCGGNPLYVYSALLDVGSMPTLEAGTQYWIEISAEPDGACPWRWSWASSGNSVAAIRSGSSYTGQDELLSSDLAFCLNDNWHDPGFLFINSSGICIVQFESFPEVSEDCDGDGTMNWCEVVNEGAPHLGDFVPDCCNATPHTCP